MNLITIFAQAAQPAPAPGGSLAGTVFMLGSIFAIFYFIMIRPQQKQRKAHEALLATVKKGDQVVTIGGIVAEVVHVKEGVKDGKPAPSADDHVTIKSGEARLVVTRGRIMTVNRETPNPQA